MSDKGSIATYDALHEGVPLWIEKYFWKWVEESLLIEERNRAYLDGDLVVRLGMALQIELPDLPTSLGVEGQLDVLAHALRRRTDGLDVADFLLAHGGNGRPDDLEGILELGKSAWQVGERQNYAGLIRRVPKGVQLAVDEIMNRSDSAGAKLANAWEALYGLKPDPTKAYSLAIKAVEDVVISTVSPNNHKATLGTVIRDIQNQKDWHLPMEREHDQAPSGEVLLGMLQMLWAGQHDRHGGNLDLPPLTHGEAVAAVSLAVTLVHWFTTEGLIQRARDRVQ